MKTTCTKKRKLWRVMIEYVYAFFLLLLYCMFRWEFDAPPVAELEFFGFLTRLIHGYRQPSRHDDLEK